MQRAIAVPFPGYMLEFCIWKCLTNLLLARQEISQYILFLRKKSSMLHLATSKIIMKLSSKMESVCIILNIVSRCSRSNIVEQAIAAKESIKERSINQPAQYTTELRKQTTNEIVASLQTRSKGTGNPVVKPPTYPEALLAFGRLPNDSPLKPIEEAVLNMTVYEMQAAKSIGDIYNKRRLADVHMTPSGIPTSSSTIPPAPSPSHNLPANTPTGPRAERGNEQVRTQSYDASRDPRLRR